jgi:magnesium chelatase subunit D
VHHLKRRNIPFTSIVGQDEMKFALMLNVINPKIGGVLIRGDKGTAKSTAVRSLADLQDEIAVIEDCHFNCDPTKQDEMCDMCLQRSNEGTIKVSRKKTPVVDLPLGATEDRVIGSLNVERAIKEGIKALEPGILAAANRGILYIDEVNLLDDHVADVLLDSAATGVNIVEREGVSVAHPSRFVLVGTMNPEEGELRPQLLDRFGLQVSVSAIDDPKMRMQIARMAEAFEANPDGFSKEYEEPQRQLMNRIENARKTLGKVTLSDDLLRVIVTACIDLGVKTHRAEIVISKTAKTIAAYEGREEVRLEDVKAAMELALSHRMRSKPFEPPSLKMDELERSISKAQSSERTHESGQGRQEGAEEKLSGPQEDNRQPTKERSANNEQIQDVGDPIDVSKVNMSRRRDKVPARNNRGRHVKALSVDCSGRYLRHTMNRGRKDIAIDATIRAAAPYQGKRSGSCAIKIESSDIREKQRVRRTSAVVLFVVDASGSMGAMQRMQSAKGAVFSLLMQSYQKRDKVGMVAFRGEDAEVVLQPCSSVDLAFSRLRGIPTGGKTPLSAGLWKGYKILEGEKKRDAGAKTMMVLITDGRANVGLFGKIKDEIMEISDMIRRLGVTTIVIDTESVRGSFMDMKLGFCQDIAEEAAGRYYPISSLCEEALLGIVNDGKRLLFGQNA